MAAVLDVMRSFFMPAEFSIDMENPGDVVAREVLLDRAMGPGRRRKSSETLRRNRVPAEGLALVARDSDSHVIGTVRLWNIHAGVSHSGTAVDALLLGPLGVLPGHDGKGIGSALMQAALAEAKARDHGAILLVGDAAYYQRFRFSSEQTTGLIMPGPVERHRFLALELKSGWLGGATGMLVASGRKLSEPMLRKAA